MLFDDAVSCTNGERLWKIGATMMTNENKSVKRPSLRHFVPHIPSSFYYFLRPLLSCVVEARNCKSEVEELESDCGVDIEAILREWDVGKDSESK